MISLYSGRIVDLGTICYEYYVPQKALNSEEQEVFLLNVPELLRGVPTMTLVNKYASLVLSRVRVVFILSNLYPLSTPSFILVLSFSPLSSSAFALVPLIYLDPSYHPLDRCSFDRPASSFFYSL
jgi:hypothetical protein